MTHLIGQPYFQILFWVVAFIFSGFYSIKAFEIHMVSKTKYNMPSLIHQYWLNFLGSIVGWIILWLLLPSLSSSIDSKNIDAVSTKKIVLLIGAFLGITGHLPMALVGLALSFKTIVDKFTK